MGDFYLEGSDDHYFGYFWEGERKSLADDSSFLLPREEANRLGVDELFHKYPYDDKPRLNKDYNFFAIPYELDDEVFFRGRRLVDEVVDFVNIYIGGDIYYASTDSDKCCVVKSKSSSEGMVWDVASGHINTPFLVFNDRKDIFLLIDYDLPVQIVGYKSGALRKEDINDWVYFFHKEWSNVLLNYSHYSSLCDLMSEYYGFIPLPK